MKITKPFYFFPIYMAASCLLIMVFRFFIPSNAIPLPLYSTQWRFVGGFLDCFDLFPALIFSGLVLLFVLQESPKKVFKRFSPGLLEYLKTPITIGIASILVYTLLFLLAAPLAHDFVSTLQLRGELYTRSKAGALKYANQGEWPEAYQFMHVCDLIWPENPENESLRERIEVGIDSLRLSSSFRATPAGNETDSRERRPLGTEPVSVTDALVMADTAFREERYYDSHWLAILAGRLARQGSVEATQAQRLAGLAWNALGAFTPSVQEEKAYYLYRQKREGYEAFVSGDWIRAYYTFKALSPQLPSDPDVANFLALSDEGARKSSFFIDEVEEHVGEMLSEAIFSLPIESGGRAVLRVSSLSTMPDVSYGTGFELMAFSANGTLRYDLRTPYVKILPINLDGTEKILVLLRALSPENEEAGFDPVWSGAELPADLNTDLILNVSYSDFLLLSRLRRGLDTLSIEELFIAKERFGEYGYITKVFEAELIYRLGEPVAMLSLVMVVIVIGWRFRSLTRPKFVGIPMLLILPMVFNGWVFCFRKIFNLLSISSVITFTFFTAVIVFGVGLLCSFILCLIMISAQHG